MPELPEVETVKRGLSRLIVNKTVSHASFDNSKSFPNTSDDVNRYLIGSKVIDVRRRAKILIIDLDSDYSLLIHLKMTGQMVFRGEVAFGAGHPNDSLIGELPDKSTRVTIMFLDKTSLYFNDQRKFGWMKLVATDAIKKIDFMMKVGPEPLEDAFTPAVFADAVRKRQRSNIKAVLLDQTVVAGIGNIYADEALFMARIHPTSLVGRISDLQLVDLHKAIREVLLLSIKHGGSTDKNYVNAEGGKGSYMAFAKVFRREGMQCEVCGSSIIKTRVAGRGTHVCVTCQKVMK